MLSDLVSYWKDIDWLRNSSKFSHFVNWSIFQHQLHGLLSIGRGPPGFGGYLPHQIFSEFHIFHLRHYHKFSKLTSLAVSNANCSSPSSLTYELLWFCFHGSFPFRPFWGVFSISEAGEFVSGNNCIGFLLLGQHHRISQNGHHVGSTRIQGWMRWDWWDDCDWIWSGMVRGWLVEIGMSHQIWWNILREHN